MTALLLAWLLSAAGDRSERPEEPPRGLLEFLGHFEDGDGEWVDPLTFTGSTMSVPDPEGPRGEPGDAPAAPQRDRPPPDPPVRKPQDRSGPDG